MTSKALEAAAEKFWSMMRCSTETRTISVLSPAAKHQVCLVTAEIIRAFAENVTEEMATVAESRMPCQQTRQADKLADEKARHAVQSAILRGLE